MSTIDRPSDSKAYQMDWVKDECTSYPFTGAITGFVQITPDMTATTETMDGVKCDKYSRTEGNSTDPWTYSVWVSKATPRVPVAVYSSDWVTTGATVNDGHKHITHFNTTIDAKAAFDPTKFGAKCVAPVTPTFGKCDRATKSCIPCKQGVDPGCDTMDVCQVACKPAAPTPAPAPGSGYSCNWSKGQPKCELDAKSEQSKAECTSICHL